MLDAIVAGAGPAGSQTALQLARYGHSVLVLDYRSHPGNKLCTGIVGRQCFEQFGIPADLVLHEACGASFVTGTRCVVMARPGPQAYVIDRVEYVRRLAERAAQNGAEIATGYVVSGVDRRPDHVEVTAQSVAGGGRKIKVRARCIVVASGAGSRVGAMAGLLPARKLAFASQVTVRAPALDQVKVFLPGIVPAGHFGWLVPQGDGLAKAGVMGRARDRTVLNEFIGYCATTGLIAPAGENAATWPVPVGQARRTFASRAVLIGDVAGQVKPATGGGIYYSLLSADLAARTLHTALQMDDLSAAFLQQYEADWRRTLGRELRVGQVARSIFERLDSRAVDRLLQLTSATGLLDAHGSFDWHADLIARWLGTGLFESVLAPLRTVGGAFAGKA